MLEPKSHSLTSERFLINQESILTHKNGIFIDWVRQPLWRDLRDYWVNMWYKSACLRRFFFFWFPHLMCSRWMNWRQRSTGTKLFSVQFSKPQLKLSQIFLENTLGLVLPAQSWPFFLNWNTPTLFASWSFATLLRPVLFVFTGSHFTLMSLCVFCFFGNKRWRPPFLWWDNFLCAKFSLIDGIKLHSSWN